MTDPVTELVRQFAQAAGLVAFLAGFGVFMLIYRITRDHAYVLLSTGFLIHFLLGLILFAYAQFLGRIAPPGIIIPIFRFLVPFLQVLGGILWIAGFIKLGRRALKRFRRPAETVPAE